MIVCFVGWLVGWLVDFRLERIKNRSARWSRPYCWRAACGREYIWIRRFFQIAGRDAWAIRGTSGPMRPSPTKPLCQR